MAHRLEPDDGTPYLAPGEVARRLAAEFAVVDVDAAAGADHVANMIRQFERMEVPSEVIAKHRALQPMALKLFVADEAIPGEAYLSFAALPDQGLFIGYSSRQHEMAAGPLMLRCCRLLGYHPDLV